LFCGCAFGVQAAIKINKTKIETMNILFFESAILNPLFGHDLELIYKDFGKI